MDSGVRNSCEASATNRRIRTSDAARAANAASICASIPLSERARRPTSVVAGSAGTRWAKSPAANASAVTSTSRSGRSARLTAPYPATPPTVTIPSPLSRSRRLIWEIRLLDLGERERDGDRSGEAVPRARGVEDHAPRGAVVGVPDGERLGSAVEDLLEREVRDRRAAVRGGGVVLDVREGGPDRDV